jgi:repressor LexA
MLNLSTRQHNMLNFIISFFTENEFPPTIREIGEAVDISSTSVVNYNLAKLVDEALLTRHKEVSRGISLNWERLRDLGLIGNMSGTGATPSANGKSRRKNDRNLFSVPILGYIAAGEPIGAVPNEPVSPQDWVEMAAGMLGSEKDLFALRVKGNSMIDASVLDGDIVVLRRQETASDGDMVAAWIEGDEETTLKYFYRAGKQVRLQPANPNPDYQPIMRDANKVRINGKVVSVIRVLH